MGPGWLWISRLWRVGFAAAVATAAWVGPAGAVRGQEEADSAADQAALQASADATVESLFTDFLHYARLGRFTVAASFGKSLLSHPKLGPAVLLDSSIRDHRSIDTLLILVRNTTVGESAAQVLELIEEGERRRHQDLERIKANIALLSGDPQQEYLATGRLVASGEYAIPQIVQTLLDDGQAQVWPRIATMLPKIGKPAVNPLVMALRVRDTNVRLTLIRALGQIGYPQAVPYLLKIIVDDTTPAEVREGASRAIEQIETISGRTYPGSAGDRLFRLGEQYYNEDSSVRSDPRLPEANVWYWDKDMESLRRVVVGQPIFGPLMAMRCCEEALRLRHDRADAIALWLAANIRRESLLGLDVRSGDPNEVGDPDPTRPPEFPRALYFTQAAGPRYAHLVLQRAVGDADSAVALGAISALRITAGASSLIGTEDIKQPLVQALLFSDFLVRARAALALGAALPRTRFADSDFVVPVLAKALTLTGTEQMVIVDGDQERLNRVAGALQAGGREVIAETNFHRAMERARAEFPVVSAFFLSADLTNPGLGAALTSLRGEFVFGKTPVVVLAGTDHAVLAEELTTAFQHVEAVDAAVDRDGLEAALQRARQRAGQSRLDPDLALSLALEAGEVLRRIVIDGRTVYHVGKAEPALIGALSATNEELQRTAASVLALLGTTTAQRAIAQVALDAGNPESLRLAMFGSLAESAKDHGNLLEDSQIAELLHIARDDDDLTIRTAASQALGAINLATDQASDIIRSYHYDR